MTKKMSGGMNRMKNTHPKVAGGDNPMALKTDEEIESSIKEALVQAYQDFKKKDQNVALQNQKKKQKKSTSKV